MVRGSDSGEADLIRRVQAGDKMAFAELVVAHQQFVYNLALRTLGEAQEAEDVAQEAFVRAWLALPRFRAEARFQTWLYRIVTNLCYNRLPRLRRELEALADAALEHLPDETFIDPAQQIDIAEKREFLHNQIEALPESYRLLLTLRYQNELSYDEIAEVLEMPLGTVKTGIFRARASLKKALRQFRKG